MDPRSKSTTSKRGGARAEEELLGPGATRERFRGAGDAGEWGGRGGSRADAGESGGREGVGRTRGTTRERFRGGGDLFFKSRSRG